MKIPYIGITDFVSPHESHEMTDYFQNALKKYPLPMNRKLMIGAVLYRENLNGLPPIRDGAMPRNEDLASIFIDHPNVFNAIHYVDLCEPGVDVLENLLRATELGGPHLNAIQLDMTWPDPDILRKYRKAHPHIHLLLLVGTPALAQLKNLKADLVRKIDSYRGVIDLIALDKSMGTGTGMDHLFLTPLVRLVRQKFPELSVAVAGGLGPNTMHLVEPIARKFPDVSIDAQSRLRSSASVSDPIDWELAKKYVDEALRLFSNPLV